jgi:hypothetical protein
MPITDSLILKINTLSEADLIDLNHAVCRNITAIRTRRMDGIRDLLSVGDNVTFTGRHRGRNGGRFPVTGTVMKIKRKNAEVRANGMTWNVNISNLTRVSS